MEANLGKIRKAHNSISYNEGDKIGKCIYIRDTERRDPKERKGLFKCVCGNEFIATIAMVRSGDRVGCGCAQSKIGRRGRNNPAYKHGAAIGMGRRVITDPKEIENKRIRSEIKAGHKSEYDSWNKAKERCTRVDGPDYPNYGGRGITFFEDWKKDFKKFLEYMGPKPSPYHSLDRWPNQNGNYEPGNLRWATPKEQARNTRRNSLITYEGQTKTLAEWAERLGVDGTVISRRIKRGWPLSKALFYPSQYALSKH
jgi:hypothetical protein